jgi:hypothetical protein
VTHTSNDCVAVSSSCSPSKTSVVVKRDVTPSTLLSTNVEVTDAAGVTNAAAGPALTVGPEPVLRACLLASLSARSLACLTVLVSDVACSLSLDLLRPLRGVSLGARSDNDRTDTECWFRLLCAHPNSCDTTN